MSPNAMRLLTASDVANLLAIPVRSVYVLAEQGVISHYKIGRRLRFNDAEVRLWLDERRREADAL